MLSESLVFGILILALRKELFNYGKQIQFKHIWLPIATFALEALSEYITGHFNNPVATAVNRQSFWIELCLYMGLMTFIMMNKAHRGFKLMGVGLALNALVVLLNSGIMPVDGTALLRLGFEETYQALDSGQIFAHRLITPTTILPFLGDVIHITPPYPFPKSVSLGDILLGFGVLYHLAPYKASQQMFNQPAKEVI